MEFYHGISKLVPNITGWNIRVKVLRSFGIYLDYPFKQLGLILSNEEEVRIEATVDAPFARYYGEFISEGEWLSITNFGVRLNEGEVMATKHLYKIYFLEDTIVKKTAPVAGNIVNIFASFTSIIHACVDTRFLVDLVGAIIEVGRLRNTANNEHDIDGFTLPFKIKDKDNNVLECMAFKKQALDFHRHYIMCGGGGGGVIIVALRWWKVYQYGPKNFMICTNGRISKVYVNPNIPEVEDIREMLEITARMNVEKGRSDS